MQESGLHRMRVSYHHYRCSMTIHPWSVVCPNNLDGHQAERRVGMHDTCQGCRR
ncbi:hypothetical protein BDQ94DRAFT_149712 [Aspergillus welwitschiae]|uniref:Uncharacterized protein n=1 Tax=Aspergillus welwitschiae TaxID=1341132 RepID=A0A3F3PSS7_9EURO|nr:hypothetical protein BDQ94DRAFT_149712 [Aspergillus welwitschiae]RDH29943.1 hypothetical protein BDQ94DRAFT_149712 [Aspergillus welwitschiae]